MVTFCSVNSLGSWRTTAGGGRALQSGAKSEAISHFSLKHVAFSFRLQTLPLLKSFKAVGLRVGLGCLLRPLKRFQRVSKAKMEKHRSIFTVATSVWRC